MTGLIDFSTDASSNDVAAPPVFWQEGQAAATVNNSSRAMMAALACWRDDNSGLLTATRGGGDVYSVATEQVFSPATAAAAHTLSFTVDAQNQGPAALSPDGQTAAPLLRGNGRKLAPGDLSPGTVYRVAYRPPLGAYVIVAPTIERPGKIILQADGDPDPGYLLCNGNPYSRTAYAALYERIGTTYGAGDGSTTFQVPDLRGRVPFAADAGVGRLTGAGGLNPTIGSVGGTEAVQLSAAQMPSHSHAGSTSAAGGHDHGGSVSASGQHDHGGTTANAGNHTHGAATTTAGAHVHTGTTNTAGSHGHALPYSVGTAGSGATNRAVTDLNPNGTLNAGGATQAGGDHTHDFTTASAGDHSHGVTVNAVGDHAHGITADGQHAHGITAVGDHTHALTTSSAGSDQAHANIPPALVVQFAIKA